MDVTNILNIQALDFDIWGFHVKANLMMSIIILATIGGCWIWYKRKTLIISQIAERNNNELERIKLNHAELEANRKKPTWCHACEVNRVYIGKSIQENVYACPKCKSRRNLRELYDCFPK